VVLLAAFAAIPAVAAEANVGLNVGSNHVDIAGYGSATVYSILGGYSFSQYIAAEVVYTDPGAAKYTTSSFSADVRATQMALTAVGSLPLGKDFTLLGKLGYASTKGDSDTTSETKNDLIWGGTQ